MVVYVIVLSAAIGTHLDVRHPRITIEDAGSSWASSQLPRQPWLGVVGSPWLGHMCD